MQLGYPFQNRGFGSCDGFDRLAQLRVRAEEHEITWMPLAQCDSDFAVHLEATDTWAMSRARIDDDEWAYRRIRRDNAIGRNDAGQCIVDRMWQFATIRDDFVLERKARRVSDTRGDGVVCVPLARPSQSHS